MQILMVVTREIAQKRVKNAKLTLQDTVSQENATKKAEVQARTVTKSQLQGQIKTN